MIKIRNSNGAWPLPGRGQAPLAVGFAVFFFLSSMFFCGYAENEIIPETRTRIVVRHHPRTGKPFVSITDKDSQQNPFPEVQNWKRPDYRMLDPKIKAGQFPYEGPSSDRRKVYALAAALATVGTVGGIGIIAAAPAATGAGAAGGAGIYGVAGGAIAAGTVSGAAASTRSGPEKDNFTHVSQAHKIQSDSTNQKPS